MTWSRTLGSSPTWASLSCPPRDPSSGPSASSMWRPRAWKTEDLETLRTLAEAVLSEITIRMERAELTRAEARVSVYSATTLALAEAASLREAIPPLLRVIGEGLNLDVGEYWRLEDE